MMTEEISRLCVEGATAEDDQGRSPVEQGMLTLRKTGSRRSGWARRRSKRSYASSSSRRRTGTRHKESLMATFNYAVRDKAGKVVKGRLDGENKDAVQARLTQMGYIIVSSTSRAAWPQLNEIKFGTGVKTKDVAIFARQFATMINAGLSLTKCLAILSARRPRAPRCARSSRRSARTSKPASRSRTRCGKHPKVFPPIFVNMVRAGETGGVLDEVLQPRRRPPRGGARAQGQGQVRDDLPDRHGLSGAHRPGRDDDLRRADVPEDVRGHGRHAALHHAVPGRYLARSSPASGAGCRRRRARAVDRARSGGGRADPGKTIWDAAKLSMPIFGPLIRKIALARFTRTFGTLVSAGVPILTALDIVRRHVGQRGHCRTRCCTLAPRSRKARRSPSRWPSPRCSRRWSCR